MNTPHNSSDREKMREEFGAKFAAISFAHKPDGIYASDVRDVVADWWLDKMFPSPKSEVSGEWEKEFDFRGFIISPCPECDGFGRHIDLTKTSGDRPCNTCNGKRTEPNSNDELKSYIRTLLSSQRQSLEREHKEWKERMVKEIEGMTIKDALNWATFKDGEQWGKALLFNSTLEQVKHLLLNEEIK